MGDILMKMQSLYALLALAVLGGLTRGGLADDTLPGTAPLTMEGDIASHMVAGIDAFLLQQLEGSIAARDKLWQRDTSSPEAYDKSVEPNRERLKKIIGLIDARVPFDGIQFDQTTSRPALVGRGRDYNIYAVRWPVLKGVSAEGLLLAPRLHQPLTDVVAIPDADQTPEMLAGLVECDERLQFARRLAENRCRVLIPTLINRGTELSVTARGSSDLTHREFVYRPAFEMGRHIIGYEVQKVLAAVDWFHRDSKGLRGIGVMGYGEGGLLALYSAAVDSRITACCASGYFDSRQDVWQEPIYRNVFALLHEFGDAELASLVAPRSLVVEVCELPKIHEMPPVREKVEGIAAPGRFIPPDAGRITAEFERAKRLIDGLSPPVFELVHSRDGENFGLPASDEAIKFFVKALIPEWEVPPLGEKPAKAGEGVNAAERHKRQLEELLEHTQDALREAEYVREGFFQGDRSSPEKWNESVQAHRDNFYNEVIGRFDLPLAEKNVRTRKIYDTDRFVGYEVVMDVFPDAETDAETRGRGDAQRDDSQRNEGDSGPASPRPSSPRPEVIAYGILLVPKGIKPDENRPCVVCQHGLEGRPTDVANPDLDHPAYHTYAAKLAEQGFVTYSPQNPYIFMDRFRTLQRKLNPLKKTLFSIIVPQHQQATDWLAELPFIDPQRIAFYGLSYGGKTAMRVPPLVSNYCLSICSADFNEWVWKNASLRSPYSYVGTIEYEIFEFNLGNTYNYFEMAGMIAPRGFMVERGHKDGVAPDSQVAYEYAKIRHLYADLGIPDRTRIEFFQGPHTIHGVGTFDFLHEQLKMRVFDR